MRPRSSWSLVGVVGAFLVGGAVAYGCSPSGDAAGGGNGSGNGGGGGSGTGTTGSGGEAGATASTGEGGLGGGFTTGTGGSIGCNPGSRDSDFDKDGYTEEDGDCNDCDPGVNPAAIEVIAEADEDGGVPEPADEDCDGEKENVPEPCDDKLAQNSMDPKEAARAVGLCGFVKKASWVQADGSTPPAGAEPLEKFHKGHGILDHYGPNNPPQEGKRLLVLSSGTARREGDPEYVHRNFDKGYTGNPPQGFPKESPSCPGVKTLEPHDATGLEVEIEAPSNGQGFSFDFNFFTFEWPQYICSEYNDFFIAYLLPAPKGQPDGNISFDNKGNPISVNNAFLEVCGCPSGPPCKVPPGNGAKSFDCASGAGALSGTPFDNDDSNPGWSNGSTGWLRTSAPVEPGAKFTLRFVTYDSSDGSVDSTTLIDNWKWIAKPGTEIATIKPPK